jgi:hypothetical protein
LKSLIEAHASNHAVASPCRINPRHQANHFDVVGSPPQTWVHDRLYLFPGQPTCYLRNQLLAAPRRTQSTRNCSTCPCTELPSCDKPVTVVQHAALQNSRTCKYLQANTFGARAAPAPPMNSSHDESASHGLNCSLVNVLTVTPLTPRCGPVGSHGTVVACNMRCQTITT